MKNILLLSILISASSYGQVNTSTADGNFYNPLNWDCFCVPANGDSLVINHDMIMSASIYYTSGQIKINAAGSLIEDGTNHDVWIDGGSLINYGTFDCYRLYLSAGSFVNTGTSVYFDSLWNKASIANSGVITVYDILNDQTATFNNTGDFVIENNFNNQGDFLNSSTGTIDLTNDFSNCNIQTMDAMFINDGIFCIAQDFTNCINDTLAGSGVYFIGNSSSNFGDFDGDFDFNTPTGGLGVNTGTIDPLVNFGNTPCYLSVDESSIAINIYPNPANDILNVSSNSNFSYQIFDMTGKLILASASNDSRIDISTIAIGIYTITIVDLQGNISTQKFIKQ